MVLCYLFSSLLLHDEIIHLNNNICIVYIRTCLRSAALIHQSTHSMLHPKFTQMLKAIYSINIESVDNMNYYRWKGGGGALLIPFQLHASICVCVCMLDVLLDLCLCPTYWAQSASQHLLNNLVGSVCICWCTYRLMLMRAELQVFITLLKRNWNCNLLFVC